MFQFIRDSEFRASLESDYKELNSALAQKNWKTVQVFAGSIIEAVLIDYLLSISHQPDPLKMDLAKAVLACETIGLITPETAKLADVLRNYRNLIHPGRSVRLNEKADENKAMISRALVGMILDAVSSKLRGGEFTAEQITKKVEDDSSAMAIVDHLLASAGDLELERLLLSILPTRYFEVLFENALETLEVFESLFRLALEKAPWFTKEKVAKRFVEIIKTENKIKVFTYTQAFFRGCDLLVMEPTDRAIIIKHMLWRIAEEHPSQEFIKAVEGMEPFLDEDQFRNLCENFLSYIIYSARNKRFAPYSYLRKLLTREKDFIGNSSIAALTAVCIRKETQKKYDQSLKPVELLRKLYDEPEISDDDIPF